MKEEKDKETLSLRNWTKPSYIYIKLNGKQEREPRACQGKPSNLERTNPFLRMEPIFPQKDRKKKLKKERKREVT
jgi:hypothetical protein